MAGVEVEAGQRVGSPGGWRGAGLEKRRKRTMMYHPTENVPERQ